MKFIITAVAAVVATSSGVVSGMEAPELRGPVLVSYYILWFMLLNFHCNDMFI